MYSVFEQLANQVVHTTKPNDLLLPARAWKVQLIGEGADDAGGVFDDTIAECCQELQNLTGNENQTKYLQLRKD